MNDLEHAIESVLADAFNLRTLLVFIVALAAAYLVSQLLAFGIKKMAHLAGHYSEMAKTSERTLRLRRAETYLSVAIAIERVIVFLLATGIAWVYTQPSGIEPLGIVGASTVFIVLAGATLTPTLRDITAGSLMILEKWYNVGDFITLDPYYQESGVVERINLRSTRIRKLNGEISWVHNQYVQRVSVAPKGVRTLAIDLYVNDYENGLKLVDHLKKIMIVDPTMLAAPLEITDSKQLADDVCQITVTGGTPPGREWLLEKFAVDLLQRHDQKQPKSRQALVYEPIVRYADTTAANRFKRAMRIKPSHVPRSHKVITPKIGPRKSAKDQSKSRLM